MTLEMIWTFNFIIRGFIFARDDGTFLGLCLMVQLENIIVASFPRDRRDIVLYQFILPCDLACKGTIISQKTLLTNGTTS